MNCIICGYIEDCNVRFYDFPEDSVRYQQWLLTCGIIDDHIDRVICSQHFEDDCFDDPVNKILKINAVPTLNLTHQVKIKNNKLIDFVEMTSLPVENLESTIIQPENNVQIKTEFPSCYRISTNLELEMIKMENRKMLKALNCMKKTNQLLTASYQKLGDQYEELNKRYRKIKAKDLRIRNSIMPVKEQYELLQKVFSEAQIKLITGNKRVQWSNDDMASAYVIRQLSNRRFYQYLVKNLKMPLPGISTYKNWTGEYYEKTKKK